MSNRDLLNKIQAATRIAWGPFYISWTCDSDWSVYDTRAIRGGGLLASGMPFPKAVEYAFARSNERVFGQEGSPLKSEGQ